MDRQQNTALHIAVRNSALKSVQALLKKNAPIDTMVLAPTPPFLLLCLALQRGILFFLLSTQMALT